MAPPYAPPPGPPPIFVARPARPPRRPRRRPSVLAIVLGVLLALVVFFGLIMPLLGVYPGIGINATASKQPGSADVSAGASVSPSATSASPTQSPTAASTTQSPAAVDGSDIQITTPAGDVGRQVVLNGTGPIPNGYQLVAFVWAPGPKPDANYFTDGNARVNSDGTWTVPAVFVGSGCADNGYSYDLIVVLLPDALASQVLATHQGNFDAAISSADFKADTAGRVVHRIRDKLTLAC